MEKIDQISLSKIRKNNPHIKLYLDPIIGTEDIRQFKYCNRKLYFRYILHAPMRPTYKMKYGTKKHEKIQKEANNASDSSQKYYNVYIKDDDLGLVGLIDYFEYDGTEAFPVEIKSGNIPNQQQNNPDKYQVTAQSMLIENEYDVIVEKVRVYYSKYEKPVDYRIKAEDRLNVINTLEEIRKLLKTEIIPKPTRYRGRCVDCECVKYCMGV